MLVKLKIVNLLIAGLKVVTIKLLFYQAKYSAGEEVNNMVKSQKFDMRNVSSRLKNIILHDQDIIDKRWAECESCEFLTKATNNCKKCGCFMKLKHRVATARCPIGKWEREYDFVKGKAINGAQITT